MQNSRVSRRGLLGVGATAGAASLAGALPAPAYAAEHGVDTSRSRRQRRAIRVATFNIHHGAGPDDVLDLEHTAEVIAATGADVVALQEVDRHFRDRSAWKDQAGELARMVAMRVAYGANIDLDPLEPGEPRRQYGCALLVRGGLLSARNTWLPKYPTSEQRGLLEAVVEIRGTRVRVATTHMQHTDDAEWQEQADAIVDLLADSPEPVFLAGDTNAVPDFPGMATFTSRYTDVWAAVGIGDGLTTSEWRFDYILTPKDTDIRHAWLISTDASDHLPLVADVVLP